MIARIDKQLDCALLIIKLNDSKIPYYLGTRNKQIVESLGITYSEKVLNSFDSVHKSKNFQFYNVLNGRVESIPTDKVDLTIFIGMPTSFLPGWLVAEHIPAFERKKALDAYLEGMKPLLSKIREYRELNMNDFGLTQTPSTAVYTLDQKIKNLNIIIPEHYIHGFVTFISYSAKLSEVFLDKYKALDYLPAVQGVFKEMNFTLESKTYEEFCEKLNEENFINDLKSIYINFLNKYKSTYIEKIKNDLQELEASTDNKNITPIVSILELKSQLNKQLNVLENFNFEDELKDINSPYIIYKYWPFKNLPPESLLINLPALERKDLKMFKSLLHNYNQDEATNILVNTAFYFDEIKQLRIKQILEHRDKFIKEIDNDITNTDDNDEKEDLNEIKRLLLNDNDLYKTEIETLTTTTELLEFWPVMLYPKPDFVLSYDDVW